MSVKEQQPDQVEITLADNQGDEELGEVLDDPLSVEAMVEGLDPEQTIQDNDSKENEFGGASVLSPKEIELQQALDDLKQRLADQEDLALREQAEMQNVRRRSQKEVENVRKFALESFANDLLPVVDSLERGLAAVPVDDSHQRAAREGIDLTLKMLFDILGKQQVEPIDPEGEVFNPELHQAMTMQPSDEVPANTVLSVMQKGFTLNGRVLRPALVAVSKSPE